MVAALHAGKAVTIIAAEHDADHQQAADLLRGEVVRPWCV